MNKTWIYNFFNILSQAVISTNIISFLIVIPSSILYITELAVIFRFKKICYKSSFFKLFAARTISSIIGLIGHFLYLRFGRIGLFISFYLKLPKICLTIFYFIAVHFFYVESIATAMLLLNRLTALLWPPKYEIIWKKLWYWPIIFVFLFPLFLSGHMLFLDVVVWVHDDNTTFTLFTQMRPEDLNDPLITAVFSIFFTVLCLFINLACLFVYKKTKIVNSQHVDSKQKMETKLTIYSILTFIGQLLFSIYMIILYLSAFQLHNFGIDDEDFGEVIFLTVFNQFAWINDLCTIAIPSFLLLWASEKMNLHIYSIIRRICCLPKINDNNIIMVLPKTFTTSSTTIQQTQNK